MTLVLHQHPLAAFCQKTIMALYELETRFERVFVDLADAESRAAFFELWPMGKMPVLQDKARGCTVPESTVIIEYVDRFYPGPAPLVPSDPDLTWRARLMDRVFDLHVMAHVQKVVLDRLRPADAKDSFGVEQARGQLAAAYDLLERELEGRTWALGEAFSFADCAAAPALFYAGETQPFAGTHPRLAAYFGRLEARPSYARVRREAEPFMQNFPRR